MSSGVMVGYNMQNKYLLLPLVHFINTVMIPYAILSVITDWYIGETTFISKCNICSKEIYKRSKRLLKMTSLKTFFPSCLKVTVYITPKIQNVLMWDRPMQIWDTNDIENINENFKLGSCVYELLMSKLIDCAYEKSICF